MLLVPVRVGLGFVDDERSDHSRSSSIDGREPTVRLGSPLAWNDETNLGKGVTHQMGLLWIILIVVLVLLLLGFFSRGRW